MAASSTARSSSRPPAGLDFDALQMRLHPAASRVGEAGAETPAAFVAFDLLAADGGTSATAAAERARARSSGCSPDVAAADPPDADDARRAVAAEWLKRFEGAGLDGVIAKPADGRLRAGQARDDQDQARAHGRLRRRRLPLAQERARAAGGIAAARTVRRGRTAASRRRDVVVHDGRAPASSRRSWSRCATHALDDHPWREWAERGDGRTARGCPAGRAGGARARTLVGAAAGRARVRGEVRPHAGRSRSAMRAVFQRWRPDKQPGDCRYDQLEVTTALRAREGVRRRHARHG